MMLCLFLHFIWSIKMVSHKHWMASAQEVNVQANVCMLMHGCAREHVCNIQNSCLITFFLRHSKFAYTDAEVNHVILL